MFSTSFTHIKNLNSTINFLLILVFVIPVFSQETNKEQEYASDKIFSRAVALAESENYNRAVQQLIPILDYYPDYSRVDEVMYNLGAYLTEMELYKAAERIFTHLIQTNIEGPMVPNAIYGLERLFYQNGDYDRALDYFRILRDKFPDNTIDDGIYYYAGQSYFFNEDFDNAILMFDAIEPGSQFWGFALYTNALAKFKKKEIDSAISDLKRILVLPKLYKKWSLLHGRTYLILGLTYYQIGEFKQAINYLEKVSSGDENSPKALLALGWCYLKLQQYQKMIKPLEKFVDDFKESEFLPEVYLLLGQAHLKIRLYDKSISYFSRILNMFASKAENTELLDSISKRIDPIEGQIENHRTDLLLSESKLLDTLQLPSKKWIPRYMVEEIQELEKRRMTLLEQINFEKQNLNELTQSLNSMKVLIQINTREWRSYAEYGISRALFLKGQEG